MQIDPTPVDLLNANIAASKPAFEAIVAAAAPALAVASFEGFVYRFE